MKQNRPTPTLTNQAAWLLIAKTIGFAVSFAAPLLIVRLLDQREFGLYKQAFLLAGTIGPLLTLGFQMNVFYFLPRQPQEGGSIVFNVLLVHCGIGILAAAVLGLYPECLELLFGSDGLVPYGPLIGLVVLFTMFSYFIEVVATANQDVRYSTLFIVMAQCTKSATFVVAAAVFQSLEALLYAGLVQGAVQAGVLIWYLRRRFPRFWTTWNWPLMHRQLRYSVPLGLAGFPVLLQNELHLYLVANRFSAAEYAIYATGCFQVPLIGLLRESVNSVMIPRIALLQQGHRTREIAELIANAMRKLALVYLPVYAFLMVCGYEVLVFLYTRQYEASWPVFVVNLTVIPLALLISDPVMRAYPSEMRFLLKVRYACCAVLVPCLYLAINRWGMMGAIAVPIAVMFVERAVVMYRVGRVLGVDRDMFHQYRSIRRIGAAALLAAAACAGARWLSLGLPVFAVLIVSGIVFCVAYVAALFAMEVLQRDELMMVRRKFVGLGRAAKAT